MSFTINGGSGDVLSSLIAQLQGSQDAANKSGLAQYQNLLDSVNNTSNGILGKHGLLNTAGQQAIYDTKQNTANSVGAANQSLLSRGLYNSTIAPNVIAGIKDKGQQSINNINEQVAGQKAGMTLDLGKLNADAILSKSNQTPDMSMYLKLIQQLAATNVGQQKMTSTAGSINSLNGPNTAFSSTFGAQAPLSATAPRPGDTYFSNVNNASIASDPLAYRF
jgi:hypothetical protein